MTKRYQITNWTGEKLVLKIEENKYTITHKEILGFDTKADSVFVQFKTSFTWNFLWKKRISINDGDQFDIKSRYKNLNLITIVYICAVGVSAGLISYCELEIKPLFFPLYFIVNGLLAGIYQSKKFVLEKR